MASVPTDNFVQQSLIQYIRSFVRALPDLHAVVTDLHAWDRITFDPRKESEAKATQVTAQVFAGAIALIHLVISARIMRRVMRHHCTTYSIPAEDCPVVGLADAIVEREGGLAYGGVLDAAVAYQPGDYRPAYARALQFEDEGDLQSAANEYRAIALLGRPGPYCLLRAADYAPKQEAIAAYQRATELYPAFALAQRKLAGSVRDVDPLMSAKHYSDALSHAPELQYGELTWTAGGRGSIEVEIYRGFRIYFILEGRRHVAFPVLLGSDDRTMQRRAWPIWKQVLGLALLRLHKDQILKRFRRPPGVSQSHAAQAAARSTSASTLVGVVRNKSLNWLIRVLWYCEHGLRNWIGRHLHYVRFGLVGRDLQDVRKQIDWVYTHWMFDGPLDKSLQRVQPTR